jgi:hypothetical protein
MDGTAVGEGVPGNVQRRATALTARRVLDLCVVFAPASGGRWLR